MELQIILTVWNTESKKKERNKSKLRQRKARVHANKFLIDTYMRKLNESNKLMVKPLTEDDV